MKTFTTPIYYVNGSPHIGHAYSSVITDTLSRFYKLFNYETWFLTGTDEHGQKVEKSAKEKNIDTLRFASSVSEKFKNMSLSLDICYNDFIRTTQDRHKKVACLLWKKLSTYIYKDRYAGWYSIRDEAFYQESELVNGLAPTGANVEWIEEECYFFKLSSFTDRLIAFYESNPDFIVPKTRLNEVLSFLKSGLNDLAVSRVNNPWGIAIPENPNHTMYVWVDALSNYLTGTFFSTDKFNKYWSDVTHVIGKDILRFHAIYWPALLMAANIPLPKTLIVHGWWTHGKEKMSKSLGNTIDPCALVEKYGVDAVRYFLLKEISIGSDGDFNEEALITRYNSDLSNNIGNLIHRVFTVVKRNFKEQISIKLDVTVAKTDLEKKIVSFVSNVRTLLKEKRIKDIIELTLSLSTEANRYVDKIKFWNTSGDEMIEAQSQLFQAIYYIGLVLQAVIPREGALILDHMSIPQENRTLNDPLLDLQIDDFVLPKPIFSRL